MYGIVSKTGSSNFKLFSVKYRQCLINDVAIFARMPHDIIVFVFLYWCIKTTGFRTNFCKKKKSRVYYVIWLLPLGMHVILMLSVFNVTNGTLVLSTESLSIVVELFNCFDAMGRNVNTQSQICGPHIFNKYIFFCNILHAWTTIFGSFSYLREFVFNMV